MSQALRRQDGVSPAVFLLLKGGLLHVASQIPFPPGCAVPDAPGASDIVSHEGILGTLCRGIRRFETPTLTAQVLMEQGFYLIRTRMKIDATAFFQKGLILKTKKMKWPLLVGSLFLCQLPGIIGSAFTVPAISSWYGDLAKPAFNPPRWVFAPVWTLLYLLMGISLYLVLETGLDRRDVRIAAGVFTGQLVLNGLWSYLFFGLRSPGAAFVEILILWLAIAVSIVLFFRIRPAAAWLLVPYILWVSFAAVLNYYLMFLNPAF